MRVFNERTTSIRTFLHTLRHNCTPLRIGFVLGIALPGFYALWFLCGWPDRIEISQRTTHLVQPLTPDKKYIDYPQAFRERYAGEGLVKLGSDYIAIDPSKLPLGTVIPDNLPPGHVSVIGPSVDELKNAMAGRGSFPR